MTMPGSDVLLSADSFHQLHLAAKAMRDLADGLDCYANEAKPNGLFKISHDLNRTGWNALYTAMIMRDLALMIQDYPEKDGVLRLEDFFQQADVLFTAINYLARGIETLKGETKRLEMQQQSDAASTIRDMAQRLKGVTHDCKIR